MNIIRENGEDVEIRAHRQDKLLDNEVHIQQTAGGCEVGVPLERDLNRVEEDVLGGYISIESARDDYGVVVDPVSLYVIENATHELVAKMSN